MPRRRLDQRLVDDGHVSSRTRAQALIMAGTVLVADRVVDKPGTMVADDALVRLRGADHPWVSRGGLKLDHALDQLGWSVEGLVALDVGASTGGFTHVLRSRGVAKVYAVDVGWGQLAEPLRQDPAVVNLERTNARHLTADHIPEAVDLVVCDASFIGLEQVLPAAIALAKPGAGLIALIKPQFEVGKGQVGKGGVVRDPTLHKAVCARVRTWLEGTMGCTVEALTESPVLGPKGNREFLIAARKGS